MCGNGVKTGRMTILIIFNQILLAQRMVLIECFAEEVTFVLRRNVEYHIVDSILKRED